MTSALIEFLILARVAGFGVAVYGVWLGVPRRYRAKLQLVASPDNSQNCTIGDL